MSVCAGARESAHSHTSERAREEMRARAQERMQRARIVFLCFRRVSMLSSCFSALECILVNGFLEKYCSTCIPQRVQRAFIVFGATELRGISMYTHTHMHTHTHTQTHTHTHTHTYTHTHTHMASSDPFIMCVHVCTTATHCNALQHTATQQTWDRQILSNCAPKN